MSLREILAKELENVTVGGPIPKVIITKAMLDELEMSDVFTLIIFTEKVLISVGFAEDVKPHIQGISSHIYISGFTNTREIALLTYYYSSSFARRCPTDIRADDAIIWNEKTIFPCEQTDEYMELLHKFKLYYFTNISFICEILGFDKNLVDCEICQHLTPFSAKSARKL